MKIGIVESVEIALCNLIRANDHFNTDEQNDRQNRRLLEVDTSTPEKAEQKVVDEMARRGPQKKYTFVLSVNGCIDPKGKHSITLTIDYVC